MSENTIFRAASNLLGHNEIRIDVIDAPQSIVDGAFLVEATPAYEPPVSIVLSRLEIRELRDSLTKALQEMEITDIVRLLK